MASASAVQGARHQYQSPRLLFRMPRNRHDADVPRLAAHQRRRPRALRADQARAGETDLEARPELRRREDFSHHGDCRARPRRSRLTFVILTTRATRGEEWISDSFADAKPVPASESPRPGPGHRSSPNRKIEIAIIENMKFGTHAATAAGSRPERPSADVIPSEVQ